MLEIGQIAYDSLTTRAGAFQPDPRGSGGLFELRHDLHFGHNQLAGTIQTERVTKSVGEGSNRAQFREVFRDFAPEPIEASGGFHK